MFSLFINKMICNVKYCIKMTERLLTPLLLVTCLTVIYCKFCCNAELIQKKVGAPKNLQGYSSLT